MDQQKNPNCHPNQTHYAHGLCHTCYSRIYSIKHKDKLNATSAAWDLEHKEERRARQNIYDANHKREKAAYVAVRRKVDINFKLARNLRSRLCMAIKGNQKTGSAIRDLGCSVDDLKKYLEKQFQPGMTWDNWGNKKGSWNIDHKIPLSKVDLTNKDQSMEVNHYFNLQPMWQLDNIKKSNK